MINDKYGNNLGSSSDQVAIGNTKGGLRNTNGYAPFRPIRISQALTYLAELPTQSHQPLSMAHCRGQRYIEKVEPHLDKVHKGCANALMCHFLIDSQAPY